MPSTHQKPLKPSSLRIASMDVPVLYEDHSDSEEIVLGQFSSVPSPFITIHPGLTGRQRPLTMFHEALHALSSFYGLELDERAVRTLEHGIVGLLRDNPALCRGLIE